MAGWVSSWKMFKALSSPIRRSTWLARDLRSNTDQMRNLLSDVQHLSQTSLRLCAQSHVRRTPAVNEPRSTPREKTIFDALRQMLGREEDCVTCHPVTSEIYL